MALSKEDLEYGYDEVAKIQQETDIVAIKLIFDARHRVKELIEQESSGKLGIQRAYVYEKKSLLSRNSSLRRWFEGRDTIYSLKPIYKRIVDVHWDHKKTTELGSLVIGLGISITLSVIFPPLGVPFAIKGLISGVTVLFATDLFENQRNRHRPNRKYNKKNFSAMKQSEYGQKLSSEIDVHLKNMRFIEKEMHHNPEAPEKEKQFLFENYKAKEVLADLLTNSNIKSQMHAFDDWDGSFGDSARRMVTHIATILTPFSELIDSEFFSSVMTCKEQELDEKFFTLGLFDYELKRIINYAEVITDTMLYLTNQFSYLTKFEPLYRNAITVGCRTTVQIGSVNDKVIESIREFDSAKKIAQNLYRSYEKYKFLHKKYCSNVCYCYERSSDIPPKIKSIKNPKYSLKPEDPKLYFRYVNPSITQEKKYFHNIFNLVDALKLNDTSEYHTFLAQMILKEHHQSRYLNNQNQTNTHSHPSPSSPDDILSAEMYKRANYVQRRSGESSASKRPDLDSDKTHNDFISYLVDPDFFHLQSHNRSRDAFKIFKDTSRLATLRIETLENYYNYQQALGMDFSWSSDYQTGNPYHELLNSLSDSEKSLHVQFVKALSKGEERVDSPRNLKDWMSKRQRNMSFTMLKATMRDVFFSISGSITTIVLGGAIGHHSPHIGNFVLGASPASTFASNVLNNCDALNKIPFIKEILVELFSENPIGTWTAIFHRVDNLFQKKKTILTQFALTLHTKVQEKSLKVTDEEKLRYNLKNVEPYLFCSEFAGNADFGAELEGLFNMLLKRFKDTENILKKIKAIDSKGNQSSQVSINIKNCLDAYNATKDYWEFVEGLEDMFSTIHYTMLIINSVWNDIQILLTFKKYFTDKMYTFMILREKSRRNGANHAITSEGLDILRTFLTRSALLRNPRTIDMLNRNANIKVTNLTEKESVASKKIHGLDSKSDRDNFIQKLNRINAAKSQIADSQGFLNLVSKIYNIKNLTLDKT